MRSRVTSFLLFVSLAATFSSANGQGTVAVVGSTVSGHVRCADTGGPARFARVLLKSTTTADAGETFMSQLEQSMQKALAKDGKTPPKKEQTEEQKRQRAAAARNMNEATDLLNGSTVGLDGGYTFVGVKPGTYYVHVTFPGYIDDYAQFTAADFASSDPAIRARIAALQKVTVNGTDTARADLRLERGAALSGRVLYDDGTPAAGWAVWALRPDAADNADDGLNASVQKQVAVESGKPIATTDDRGMFRIAGLAGGKYVLRANESATPVGVGIGNINQAGSGIRLTVYAPGTFDHSAAKAISVAQGDEHVGADITVPERRLHSLVGHVYAVSDNHALNKGDVSLTSKAEPSLHLKAPVRDDGSFHFDYLPGDTTYTLSVASAADATYKTGDPSFLGFSIALPAVKQSYEPATQDVLLGNADNNNVRFSLAPTGKSVELQNAPAP